MSVPRITHGHTQLCHSPITTASSANAWSLTLRTEKVTFCPGSRTRPFLTSDEMNGTLKPSAPSMIPNPCTSIFFTVPVILSVLLVQNCSRSASRSALGWATDFSIHCSFPARDLSVTVGTNLNLASFGQKGSHSITNAYAGDRNFTGSTSAALAEVVNPAATSTALTSSANPILVRSTVTFTATVSSSSLGAQTGKVNFYLDGSSTAAASVNLSNGAAKYSTNSLSAGSHSVVAVFNSTNPNFAGSTSSTLTQYVSDFTVAVPPQSSLTLCTRGFGSFVA